MTQTEKTTVPIRAVEKPILCSPYEAPKLYWEYSRETGQATKMAGRRPGRYWYKLKDNAPGQLTLELAEGQDDLVLVNQLRADVTRWREGGYENTTPVTRELLRHWASDKRPRRLFFCQLEAVETIIYVAEVLRSGKTPRFAPQFALSALSNLADQPADGELLPLNRFGCKMATGSGKTVVMAMLIAWTFCNRARNPFDERFPKGVLVCCPNLTVKERLQVLRPDREDNYYEAFDLVPVKMRTSLQWGKVLIENWHQFAPESEHVEGGKSYTVVNKGAETADAFARRVLGDLYDRMPLMVLNDEAHHCYRPAPLEEKLSREEAQEAAADREEATVWVDGLDRINNCAGGTAAGQTSGGIAMCVDLSATPFYLKGSGYAEGRPFSWLVDAIESGIVKIPRLPVSDTTGRPEAKYFKLWRAINDGLQPAEKLPGKNGKPKPEVVYREAEPALMQLSGQWLERYRQIQESRPGQEVVPPVLIIVCDNTDIAEVFYQQISGEREEEIATEADLQEVLEEEDDAAPVKKVKAKHRTTYSPGSVLAEFTNTAQMKRTIRIDSKLLAEAEIGDGSKSRQEASEALRQVVATVGKPGKPGEHVRCVVSVSMLTEGWDASNVTHILGIRAFGSQLLCEQVVGRGLRRMDYTPDPETGLLTEEYVDVYGIPFTVVPFKGRAVNGPTPDDRPKQHVKAMPERETMAIRFPVVEGYAFGLTRNRIRCDVAGMEGLEIEPNREPTATFLLPTVGYQEGTPAQAAPFGFEKQDRHAYYARTHLQSIKFQIARGIVAELQTESGATPAKQRILRLQSRHQLFPQVLQFVDEFVAKKVNFRGADHRELGMRKYVERIVERIRTGIEPDVSEGEPPLLPILNRYKPIGTSAEVDFKTVRPCHGTQKSHVNQVVLDTDVWESCAAFHLEDSELVTSYVRNDHLGLVIPYEFQGIDHSYEPDMIACMGNGLRVLLEIKGYEDDQTRAKHAAARQWGRAVNNWGKLGQWYFHVCRDPNWLSKELKWIAENVGVGSEIENGRSDY